MSICTRKTRLSSAPSCFPNDRFQGGSYVAVLFVCASVVSYVVFVLQLFFLISPSFGTLGRLCFVQVVFSGYLKLYVLFVFLN